MPELTIDELAFFDERHNALPLYECLKKQILDVCPEAEIRVKKTQISFYNAHLFAAVSFAPVRRAKDRPASFITLTFGLDHPVHSPRIDAAVEPYPNRWTHHVMLTEPGDIDGELMAWIREAAAFSAEKRRRRR